MRRIKLFILILTLVLLTVFTLAGCRSQETSKIRLWEVTRSIFYAPQYVAIYEGYFEEEGIDIDLYNAGGADKVMTGVLAGQADIGFSGAEAAIYVFNEGHEDYPEVFAQLTQKDGSFLVSREPEPDFKWEDLEGKTGYCWPQGRYAGYGI
ncbi:MAG TPA: ABC transporter substrate-binding protein [Bacillota bacterium]|nr:ABC transporter substrate-binding protein [Bacillota bacterium]